MQKISLCLCAALFSAAILPAQAEALRNQALTYRGSFAGVPVLSLHAGVAFRPDGYELDISFHTTGAIDLLMHSDVQSQVDGVWQAGRAVPVRYVSAGVIRGHAAAVEINYPDGQPHVARLLPAHDPEREDVPQLMQRDTMDGLSALVDLLETVATTGGCDGTVTTFDGRRVARVESQSRGQQMVPERADIAYHGAGLRCDITTTALAGLPRNAGPDDAQRRPRHSSVWLAAVQPNGPLVPVLIEVELRIAGRMTLTLTDAR